MKCRVCDKEVDYDGSILFERCSICINKEVWNSALDKLVNTMKEDYLHKVGTQFDNCIFEMKKVASRLKKWELII